MFATPHEIAAKRITITDSILKSPSLNKNNNKTPKAPTINPKISLLTSFSFINTDEIKTEKNDWV